VVGLAILLGLVGARAGDAPGLVWGEGPEAVLLLHDDTGSPADFATLGPRLAADHRIVLAPELPPDADALTVRSAVTWLGRRGAKAVHIVGVGRGANLALHAAASIPTIIDVALLAPRPRTPGLELSAAVRSYDDRPLLVVAAASDALAARTASFVHDRARGPRHLELYADAETGARLLTTTPELEPLLVAWCSGSLLRATPPHASSTQVRSSRASVLETRGVPLDERER